MRFSIVIPIFNAAKWLDKCLISVLNQKFNNYELILVDDISTDNGLEIIDRYYELFKNKNIPLKVIVNKTKRLSGGTRNVGISESSGEYIICIDCDDWLIDDYVLQDIDNKLKDEDIMFLGFKQLGGNNSHVILNISNSNEALNTIFAANWLKVVKRDLYLEHLLPEGTLFEDRINHIELCIYGTKFTSLGRATHIWNRTNENSMTFNPKWCWYRFEYCGELFRLIKKVSDDKLINEDIRERLKNELIEYINSCKKMVEDI